MRASLSSFVKRSVGAWLCASLLTAPLVFAQDNQTSRGLAGAGYEAYQKNDFAGAAALLEQLLEKFPTSEEAPNGRYLLGLSYYSLGKYAEAVKALENTKGLEAKFLPIAQFHLGVCLYLTKEYDKAYPLLEAVAKSDNKELQPFALLYYAQAKYTQALQQPAVAKQAAADGSAKIDQLISSFPDSDVIPDAIMTKANLFIAARDFTQAAKVLNELKARPDAKDLELDIDLQLGFTYTQQAKALRDEYQNEAAMEAINKAREVYARLAKNDNLVLANQAAFELANLEFDAAVVAEPQDREAAFQKAIDAYRSLKSKESLIESQSKIVEGIRDNVGKSGGDPKRVAALTRLLQRETQKLSGLQGSGDQAIAGLVRIGDCFQRMGKYDEARLIYRAALPLTEGEPAANLNTQIIITLALQGQSQKAEAAYEKFKQEHASDPNAAAIPYFLGVAFTQEKKYDEAIQKFDQLVKDYPGSPYVARVPQAKATAYLSAGKVDEALKIYDDFIATAKVSPEELDSARQYRGYALLQANKTADAIAAFKQLSTDAKNPALREDATMLAGDYSSRTGKQEQAIEMFQSFLKNFPDSPRAATAAYSIGFALEGQKKYPEAVKAYQDAIEKYPRDKATQLKCYERVWRCYLAQNDYDNMVKAQDAQIAAFPGNERNLVAYYERGKYLDDKGKPLDEIAAAYMKVTEAFDALPASQKTGDTGRKLMAYPSLSLLRISVFYQKKAQNLGSVENLDGDSLAAWKAAVENAYKYVDIALQKYNQTNLPNALQNMNRVQLLRVSAKLTTVEDATTYLSKLAGVLGSKDGAQIMIARAAFVYELGNKTQALNFYKEAFGSVDPADISWQDYDRYGSILLDNKSWQDAKQVFGTLMKNYETDPADSKQKGVYDRARACATYGLGAVEAGLGNMGAAEEFFKTLKEKYPWSEKLLNAEYQRGVALAEKGQYAEAFDIWKKIMSSSANNNEIKARTMVSFAQTLIVMGDKGLTTDETKPKGKPEVSIYDLAAQYGMKAYFFYPDEPVTPEGLYLAVQMYSQKLKDRPDAKANVKKWYDILSQKYPTSPWTSKAQGLL